MIACTTRKYRRFHAAVVSTFFISTTILFCNSFVVRLCAGHSLSRRRTGSAATLLELFAAAARTVVVAADSPGARGACRQPSRRRSLCRVAIRHPIYPRVRPLQHPRSPANCVPYKELRWVPLSLHPLCILCALLGEIAFVPGIIGFLAPPMKPVAPLVRAALNL